MLKIVPGTGEVRTIGGPLPEGKYKWGGATQGPSLHVALRCCNPPLFLVFWGFQVLFSLGLRRVSEPGVLE